jgi:hypothetical protein
LKFHQFLDQPFILELSGFSEPPHSFYDHQSAPLGDFTGGKAAARL